MASSSFPEWMARCPHGRALWRSTVIAISCVIAMCRPSSQMLLAQGVTTAGIHGFVRASDGRDVNGVRVTILNAATGVATHTTVRHGRFVADGLEVGGPYRVLLSGLGFAPQLYEGVVLALGEPRALEVVMQPAVTALDTVAVLASSAGTNLLEAGSRVADPLLHRLPTLNRNEYDFVELSPYVSTKIGFTSSGMSAGGEGFRFNQFLLDGVSQRSVSGQVPPEFSGAESVPFDAVREYRILVSPFDVRYGDFTGALVEAVTRSGTNHFEGSIFSYWRSDRLARQLADTSVTPYDRLQYGFSFGGPIRRDRLHFFVAADLQQLTSPAAGPYVGQPRSSVPSVPVTQADVARLTQLLSAYGLRAGSAGSVENENPLGSLFTRLDASMPGVNSRAILWMNDTWVRNLNFSRVGTNQFPLSTFAATAVNRVQTAAVQLHTDFHRAGGGHNELIVSGYRAGSAARSTVRQPIISVSVPNVTGGTIALVTGTTMTAQGTSLDGVSSELRDELTLPLGERHIMTIGGVAQRFRANRHGVPDPYGTWSFASLDSLAQGLAKSFTVDRDFGSANVSLQGEQYALYVGDQWQTNERLSVTAGIRSDLLDVSGHPPYNGAVDSIFGRRTDEMPPPRVEVSPRLGFEWNVSGAARDRLRGGIGIFSVRPPIAWLHATRYLYGVGIGTLHCGVSATDVGPPPAFTPDYRAPPLSCANAAGIATAARNYVDLLDHGLRMGRTWRAAVGYDRRLSLDVTGSLEAMITHSLDDFAFVNLNLSGPVAMDAHGRVLYGAIDTSGVATPALRSKFDEVIDLRNVSGGSARQVSARLVKHVGEAVTAMASYTLSRVNDVETPLRVNTMGTDNWASRAVAGREDDLRPGISLNDIPHRVVFAATGRAPWRRWPTELSLYYVGESGSPFTYLAFGADSRLGDLNADGSNLNDPIYVPKSALDTNEIRFKLITRTVTSAGGMVRIDSISAAQQADAFERFIEGDSCLQRQRGHILERNSCRAPWSNTTVASLRQTIPLGGRTAELEVDVYNLLNLLRRQWGIYRVANPMLLEQVGETAGLPSVSQPIFQFAPARARWTPATAQSSFQLQIGLRYQF